MKFLHAADIHLDSPLAGLTRRDIVPPHVTRTCTRRAFENLIDLAIAEDVAFVLIAGDLYDADWRDFSTGLFFADQMRRLGRPCLLIRGNHDAASVITRSLEPPPNVTVLSARKVESVRLDAFGVVIHGQSFPNRAVPEDLSAAYPPPVAGRLNIGMLHTSAEDPGEHETYAPCRIESLALKGYDYWALGHIHIRQELRPTIIFPGNIQGRNPRETGAKGCTLVHVTDNRIVRTEHRPTDVLRWAQVPVDVNGAETTAEIAAHMRFALASAMQAADGRPLIVRLTLQGATDCHAAMLADPQAIDAECRNAAAAVSGDLYIERVRIDTRMTAAGANYSGDSIAQLEEAFRAALDDPDTQGRIIEDIRALAAQVPRLAGRPQPDLPVTAEALKALAPEVWHGIAHALMQGDPA
jgi:DNA repair exonuclease SbcCD nuclease subunit